MCHVGKPTPQGLKKMPDYTVRVHLSNVRKFVDIGLYRLVTTTFYLTVSQCYAPKLRFPAAYFLYQHNNSEQPGDYCLKMNFIILCVACGDVVRLPNALRERS